MSVLNDIKKLAKEYPNHADLGLEVVKYLDGNKTCCDKPENIIEFKDADTHPYGWTVTGTKCKVCGELIEFNLED